jgi:hypothetical protein
LCLPSSAAIDDKTVEGPRLANYLSDARIQVRRCPAR